jgi:hypothetical protein
VGETVAIQIPVLADVPVLIWGERRFIHSRGYGLKAAGANGIKGTIPIPPVRKKILVLYWHSRLLRSKYFMAGRTLDLLQANPEIVDGR